MQNKRLAFAFVKKTKIGFINWYDPNDRKALSGTPYKISEQLKAIGYEIIWIKISQTFLYRLYNKIISILNKFSKRKLNASHTIIGAILQSSSIKKKLIKKCDLLLAPMASEGLYTLKTDIPIIYLSDATFSIMVGYYFKNLSQSAIRQGNKIEQIALNKSTAIIVSSDWARNSVINDYHQSPHKVHVIEFGANIDPKDIIKKTYKFDGHLNLLFLGVDWIRKGGKIAVEATRYLNDIGIPTTLHIVGIKNLNNEIKDLPYVNYIGFLNKNIPEQYNLLVSTIRKCHCLLLPTLAECSAIAFCESSANGLPIFSHKTGGVENYVHDGKNGYLLPLGSTGNDFGKKIQECLENGELEKMAITAPYIYEEKLNWTVWSKKVEVIIQQIIGNDRN